MFVTHSCRLAVDMSQSTTSWSFWLALDITPDSDRGFPSDNEATKFASPGKQGSTGEIITLVMQSLELLNRKQGLFAELGRNVSRIVSAKFFMGNCYSGTRCRGLASCASLLAAKQFDVKTPQFTPTRTFATSYSKFSSELGVPIWQSSSCHDSPPPYLCSGCPALDLSSNSAAYLISCSRWVIYLQLRDHQSLTW
jgi:hypothetical protein